MNEQEERQFKTLMVGMGKVKYKTLFTKKYENRKPYEPKDPNKLKAFIPGTILKVFVSEGKPVKKGGRLLILEAMKMKNVIQAPMDCTIKAIHVKEGDRVPKDCLLIELE